MNFEQSRVNRLTEADKVIESPDQTLIRNATLKTMDFDIEGNRQLAEFPNLGVEARGDQVFGIRRESYANAGVEEFAAALSELIMD